MVGVGEKSDKMFARWLVGAFTYEWYRWRTWVWLDVHFLEYALFHVN